MISNEENDRINLHRTVTFGACGMNRHERCSGKWSFTDFKHDPGYPCECWCHPYCICKTCGHKVYLVVGGSIVPW